MYLDVGMDDGDVIEKEVVEIGEEENAGELWDRLALIGSKLLVKTLTDISNGIIKRTKQEGKVVIAPKIEKEISKIDWKAQDALTIKNLIRGLTPGIGVYSELNGKKIKFWKAKVLEDDKYKEFKPGTVVIASPKEGLYIKTINGILSILEIQGENSRRMNISDFLRGNKIEVRRKVWVIFSLKLL